MNQLIVVVVLLLAMLGYGGSVEQTARPMPPDANVPPGAGVSPAPPEVKVEPRQGVVAEVDLSQEGRVRFLLHGDQLMSSGEPIKTWVTVDDNSVVLMETEQGQVPGLPSDIQVGDRVAVTIEGPELLSYPSQAYGDKVVIQSSTSGE